MSQGLVVQISAVTGLLVGLFSGFSSTHAGEPVGSNGDQPRVVVVAWDEFKARCAHPEKFDVQRAPQNIRVQCVDERLTWMAAPPNELTLPVERRVGSAVYADKFHVAQSIRDFEVQAKAGSCHRFQEYEERVAVERPVSCDEILTVKGDVHDWCASVLDGIRSTQPKVVERKETNRIFDTCADAKIRLVESAS